MKPSVQIFAIKYGETYITQDGAYLGGDEKKKVKISLCIYLIKMDKRNILIDAGCEKLPGFSVENHVSPVEILMQTGASPEEITDIVITHSHYDHIQASCYYKKARFYIQKEEYEQGKEFIPNGSEVICFGEEYSLSEMISIKKVGGHSIGSSIVLANIGEKRYVFCGDEVYSSKCIREKIPTGASFNKDKSRQFIKEYANGNYNILCCHDLILRGRNGIRRIF